jgi:O-antigen ligase/polysaccharide polymerase Wzy-like membrane protein
MSWRASAFLLLISWGSLSFGAVYPWAFIPLYVGCAAVGIAGFLQHKRAVATDVKLAISLGLLTIAIAVQLVPLHVNAIHSLTPETDAFLRRYVLGYAIAIDRHPLSIEPAATTRALLATCALGLLLLGSVRVLSESDTLHVARGVAVLGVVLALVGIAQKAMWNGKIYGFWTPHEAGTSFGPFVNRNHFAGWMLMALPLVIGYFCSRVARGMKGVKPGWRNRVLWLSSAEANQTILAGSAALLMALALVLSMSRSGALGLLVALVIAGWFVTRGQSSTLRRAVLAGFLIFVGVFVVWWVGVDQLATRFNEPDAVGLSGRLGIWADTWRIVGRFPLVGTGLNTFGTATLFYQTTDPARHYAQAHNDYLQLLSDGGLLVCIPAAVVLVVLIARIAAGFRQASGESGYWIKIGALTGILAIAFQETVEFSLQMPGNAALFVILVALASRRSRERATS